MNVYEMKQWLDTLDPFTEVIIEGLTYSSNVDKETGNFYTYHENKTFNTKYSTIQDGKLYIGVDV